MAVLAAICLRHEQEWLRKLLMIVLMMIKMMMIKMMMIKMMMTAARPESERQRQCLGPAANGEAIAPTSALTLRPYRKASRRCQRRSANVNV